MSILAPVVVWGFLVTRFFYTLKAKWIEVLISPLLTPWPMKYYDLRWMSSFFAQDGARNTDA